MHTKPQSFAATVILILIVTGTGTGLAQEGVIQVSSAGTAEEFQEMATAVRGMTECPQVSSDSVSRTLTVRGPAGELALAGWLVKVLDTDSGPDRNSTAPEHQMPDGAEVVRVFYVDGAATVRDLQEIATTLRSTSDARRLFVLAGPNAIVFRGDTAKANMTEWLFDELNHPVNWRNPRQEDRGTSAREFSNPENSDDMVRVFYLTHATNPQKDITQIRRQTRIPRVFFWSTPKAMTVRGTPGQIAQVESMVNDLYSQQ